MFKKCNDSEKPPDKSVYLKIENESEEILLIKPRGLKRRWLILGIFMLLSVMNNLTQFSFSPITELTLRYYNISDLELNLLALVYMISGFTTRFLAMWLIDNKGLGNGIFAAATLNCIGSWIRYFPGHKKDSYMWLLAGQSICAISQSFIDIAGPKIAANWFPPRERTTATALGQGGIFVAVLISYAVTPFVVNNDHDFVLYLLVEAIVASVAAFLVFALFRGAPPVPPSYSALVEKIKFLDALGKLARRKNFLLMFVVFSITMGCALSFAVLMDEILKPSGYTNKDAGTVVTVWISGSIIGGALGGPIVDKTHAYKPFILVTLSMTTIAILWFSLYLQFIQHNIIAICVIIGIIGLGAASVPAILEATIETIYPIPEATAMGVLFLGLNVSAVIFTLGMQKLKNPTTGEYWVPMYLTVGLCTLSVLLTTLFKPDYRRLEYENLIREQEEKPTSINEDP